MTGITVETVEQVTMDTCAHCGGEMQHVFGNLYADGEGMAIYHATLFTGHSDRAVQLAIAVRGLAEETSGEDKLSLTLLVKPTETEFQMQVLDADYSPWQNPEVFGRALTREEALASRFIGKFFHFADHIVMEDSRVNTYLDGQDRAGEP